MDKGELLLNDDMIDSLRREIREGTYGLNNIPQDLVMIIERDMWRKRLVKKLGEVVEFDSFQDFVTALPLEGLGTDIRTLQNLCRDDKTALDALDEATTGHQGERTDLRNNITEVREEKQRGTSNTYALRKLRKDRPDLHERVLADELSPHKAMVEAGFREKTFTVSSNIHKAARTLAKHFDADELCAAMKGIS